MGSQAVGQLLVVPVWHVERVAVTTLFRAQVGVGRSTPEYSRVSYPHRAW
jgi:hypothetical protein